jgi:hypothetical protein
MSHELEPWKPHDQGTVAVFLLIVRIHDELMPELAFSYGVQVTTLIPRTPLQQYLRLGPNFNYFANYLGPKKKEQSELQ